MRETICAISSPAGLGAIALVRVSGEQAFDIAARLFSERFEFMEIPAQVAKFGTVRDGVQVIDQVVVTKFAAPRSYTGENMVEISCHGSLFIQKRIVELLLDGGCRLAEPGEFTQRAFLNGKLDLPQAEAVADLIDSQSEASHRLAIGQLRGDFSSRMKQLREQFVQLASLIELELDFSEEDVEFANRGELLALLDQLEDEVVRLVRSFQMGNALKNGIPVAIVGRPNVGKSTLLNAILQHERAIVSNIPGTTRDTIEDTFTLDGNLFRFIDTAGIRQSEDEIENFGIQRTYDALQKSLVVLYMTDLAATTPEQMRAELEQLKHDTDLSGKHLVVIANKMDAATNDLDAYRQCGDEEVLFLSAKTRTNIEALEERLRRFVREEHLQDQSMLTNERHYELLRDVERTIGRIRQGLESALPTDLLAEDVRVALYDLGCLTGTISTEDLLSNIFGKFCIGK